MTKSANIKDKNISEGLKRASKKFDKLKEETIDTKKQDEIDKNDISDLDMKKFLGCGG